MKRYVVIPVDDGEKVVVYSAKGMKEREVPVPQGDKLIRDVDRVTGYAIEVAQDEIMPDIDCGPVGLDINAEWKGFIRTARRLRTAFGLDES